MSGILYLAWRHAAAHRARTSLLVACVALALWVPWTAGALAGQYDQALRSRAAETPLIIGAPGNRYDLTLAALYFRPSQLETIPYQELERLQEGGRATFIPLHMRFTARGYPIVATSVEYAEFRGLQPAEGRHALRLGEVALGADVAAALGLRAGDALLSDPTELYDISRPPALKMRVAGVYPPAGTPDDGAVFCDVRTAWVLEGIAHGHAPAEEIDEALVLSRADESVGDLLGVVFRIKAFFDLVGVFLLGTTALLVSLVFLLSSRLRGAEMRTLDRIGAPRRVGAGLIGIEAALVLLLAGALAGGATAATLRWLPDLVSTF